MKVELEKLCLSIGISDTAYVGILNKDGRSWKYKKNVDNDFIHAVVTRWKNNSEIFIHDGYEYTIAVKVKKNNKTAIETKIDQMKINQIL